MSSEDVFMALVCAGLLVPFVVWFLRAAYRVWQGEGADGGDE